MQVRVPSPATIQCGGAVLLLAALLLMPPPHGAMLLVPLGAPARARLLPLALAHGATLVGRGPFSGSVVVAGARAALLVPLAGAGIVTLAAPPAGCGTAGGRGS